jgi:ribose 5-phosphate isomerase
MEKKIKNITGVIESGLFIGYNVEVVKWKKSYLQP